MLVDKNDFYSCSLSYVFNVIGGKWKPYIIWYLYSAESGFLRYGELKRKIPWQISHKMFSQQLDELEQAGVVKRVEYEEKPLRVEYSLTEAGKLIAPAILYLRDWGAMFGEKFTEEDMLDRTLANKEQDTLVYEYSSDLLKKRVSITLTLNTDAAGAES